MPLVERTGTVIFGLFALSFLLRLLYALQLPSPGLDDPAYYIQVARSLYHNGNLDVSILWNFNPRFENVTHPGMEFWQPLSSFAIALSFLLFGDNLFAAQLPSLLAGSLLPPFAYLFARRLSLQNAAWVGVLAGALLVFSPLLAYQSTLPDSSMLYAVPVVVAFLLLTRPPLKPLTAFATGLLLGIAYLARTPALFAGLVWFMLLLPRLFGKRANHESWREAVFGAIGVAIPVGIWSLRNLLEFGYISSPAGTQTIFLFDYESLFNYSTPLNFQTWLEGGLGKIAMVRVEALLVAWRGTLDIMFIPSVIPAAIGLWLLARRFAGVRPAAFYTLLLFLGLPLIFGVASTNGSYYHSAGSCAPFLAVGEIYALQRFALWLSPHLKVASRSIYGFLLGFFLLASILWLATSAVSVVQTHRTETALFNEINIWLSQHPPVPVITNQPSTLNYVSGLPGIRLPANESLTTLLEVAHRYKAGYIVITERMGLYPALLQAPENKLFPLLYRSPKGDFEVYGIT